MYGYNSYGSRGSSSLLSGIGSLGNLSSLTGVLILVAFVAAIVLTVLGYRKFISKKVGTRFRIKDTNTWGPFLRFDTLLIEKVLQVFYLFNTLFIAFVGVAAILGSFTLGVGGFLLMLVSQIVSVALLELLNRIIFEAIMLGVITARNTTAIRNKLEGSERAAADGAASPSPMPVPPAPAAPAAPAAPFVAEGTNAATSAVPAGSDAVAPTAPVAPVASAVAEEPVAPVASEPPATPDVPEGSEDSTTAIPGDAVTVEPGAATEGFSGSFCPFCGAEAAPGSRFCGNCGKPLE
jgi:hypothetical protein